MVESVDLKEKIKGLENRVRFLEKLTKWDLFAMDLLVSLGELQHNASVNRDPERIFAITRQHLKRLMNFDVMAFFMVDESDSNFVLSNMEPESERNRMQREIDMRIEHGTFAWALNQNRPMISQSEIFGKTVIMHLLATKSRVRGMFVGVVPKRRHHIFDKDVALFPLSIILHNTANALEGAALYEIMLNQKKILEEKVRERTQTLEEQTYQLKQEIAYRRLAEEALIVAKDEADCAARIKSEFLANMSHEIRTPISAIIGYSELLLEETLELGLENLTSDLKTVNSAGNHLLDIINGILDLSKMEAGKMELHSEVVDIANMVGEVVTMIRPLADRQRNVLEMELEDGLGTMLVDLTRLRQILLNLLGNAFKFTERGVVTIRAHRKISGGVEGILFSVTDTGIGMTPEQVQKLFQVFSQADGSTTRKYGGTGLGLAICRRLSLMMGGDISVTSDLGKGSTFNTWIPLYPQQTSSDSSNGKNVLQDLSLNYDKRFVSQPSVAEADSDAGKANEAPVKLVAPTVLIINHEKEIRDRIVFFLESKGYNVLTAGNGEEGIRAAKEHSPAAILLDVMMPGMDGWTVLSAFKKEPKLADIPVIMLSVEDNEDRGFALGVSDYLAKPLDFDHFQRILNKYGINSPDSSILLVEDDKNVRNMLVRIFNKEHIKVACASNGKEALRCIAENPPSLIIMDLMMPEMNGFEFVSKLRKDPEFYSIPVVVLTAKDLSYMDRVWLSGCVETILQKGDCTRDKLLEEVYALLRNHVGKKKEVST